MAKVNDGRTYLVEMEKMPENRREKTGKGKRSKVKRDKDLGSSRELTDQERLKRGKDSGAEHDYNNLFRSVQLLPEVITSKYHVWLQHL